MYMKDCVERLDDFLKMTGNEILQNAGMISHEQALKKAKLEYDKYKELNKNTLTKAEEHFIKQIDKTSKGIENKNRDTE